MGVMLDRQIQRRVSWVQVAQPGGPVGQAQDRHLPEHRPQPPPVASLHASTRDLVVADDMLQALLTDRP
jgi:hypothetical protein